MLGNSWGLVVAGGSSPAGGGGAGGTWSDVGGLNVADVEPVAIGTAVPADSWLVVEHDFTAPAASFGNAIVRAVSDSSGSGVTVGFAGDLVGGAGTVLAGGFHFLSTDENDCGGLYGFYDSITAAHDNVGGIGGHVVQIDAAGSSPSAGIVGFKAQVSAADAGQAFGAYLQSAGVASFLRGAYIASHPQSGTVSAVGLEVNHAGGVALGEDWAMRISGLGPLRSAISGSLVLGADPGLLGGADGEPVLALGDVAVAPSGTLPGGGCLFVESGALKFLGAAGTVTTLAPA